jgi:hypothetical protein
MPKSRVNLLPRRAPDTVRTPDTTTVRPFLALSGCRAAVRGQVGVVLCHCAACLRPPPEARPSKGHGGTLKWCANDERAHALTGDVVRAACVVSPPPTPVPPGHPGRCETTPGALRPSPLLCCHPYHCAMAHTTLCRQADDAPSSRATNSSPSSDG